MINEYWLKVCLIIDKNHKKTSKLSKLFLSNTKDDREFITHARVSRKLMTERRRKVIKRCNEPPHFWGNPYR